MSLFKILAIGGAAGLLWYLCIIQWLTHVTVLGYILLAGYLAGYISVWAVCCRWVRQYRYRVLFVSLAWVLLEYLRTYLFGGFGWALLGYGIFNQTYFIQPAEFIGAYGISFIIVWGNAAIAEYLLTKRRINLVVFALMIAACVGYSAYVMKAKTDDIRLFPVDKRLTITVYQPNIPQEQKWDAQFDEDIKAAFEEQLPTLNALNTDMVIFPESSWPTVTMNLALDLADFSERLHRLLLIGAINKEGENYYNTAFLLRKGIASERYHKMRLVPFGEYVPLRKYLTFIEILNQLSDMSPGTDMAIFEVKDTKFAVLICFEDVFPDLSSAFVRKGAQFLVTITNDAWFEKSTEPTQHLAASVFRSIENRKYMVRSANTGISGFIDPLGRTKLLADGKIFVAGMQTDYVYPNSIQTFYTKYGNCLILVFLIPFLFLLNANRRLHG